MLKDSNSGTMQETNQNMTTSQQNEEKERAEIEMKHSILSQILTQSARARLNTLMIAKPDKGQQIESMLIQMAQRGQILTRIDENELINLLENINQKKQKATTVNFDRRRAAFDSDDDDF